MVRYDWIDVEDVSFRRVKSSIIERVWYHDGSMYVVFSNKNLYVYKDVPKFEYNNMISDKSVGGYFKKNLASYQFKKYVEHKGSDK